jgi:hypothetical protein
VQVYGETSFDLVEQIIKTIGSWEGGYFIDLGSGEFIGWFAPMGRLLVAGVDTRPPPAW